MTPPTVAVSGGGGYVGSVLAPGLLARGYRVRVLDLFLYGREALPDRPGLTVIEGDVRDRDAVRRWVRGAGAVIHLAGVSNDPSCALAPHLSRSVNVDGSRTVVDAARVAGVALFVFASSASVYGVADGRPVDETAPPHPITEYGVTKRLVEDYLRSVAGPRFQVVALRPAALYGYAPRLRLDLTVNLFTNHAVNRRHVTVFGGAQMRPILDVDDACRLLRLVLGRRWSSGRIEVFNAAAENLSVAAIAARVVALVNARYGGQRAWTSHDTTPSDDRRSYTIDATKARRTLGFVPRRSIDSAVRDLCDAFDRGLVPDALTDDRYHNVRRLERLLDA